MTPEQKVNVLKWCEALESDLYKQGKGCLRNKDNQYCCLGVALDIIDPAGWSNITIKRENLEVYTHDKGIFSHIEDFPGTGYNYMSKEIRDLFGITIKFMNALAAQNDSEHSFQEISQYIRTILL